MSAFTPGEWKREAHIMTARDLATWAENAVKEGRKAGGANVVHFITVQKADGLATVAVVGNGPDSLPNAALLTAAPDLRAIAERLVAYFGTTNPATKEEIPLYRDAVAALAKAEP